jgi:hypothetical protein
MVSGELAAARLQGQLLVFQMALTEPTDDPDFWLNVLTAFIGLHGIALVESQSLRRPNLTVYYLTVKDLAWLSGEWMPAVSTAVTKARLLPGVLEAGNKVLADMTARLAEWQATGKLGNISPIRLSRSRARQSRWRIRDPRVSPDLR